MREQFDSENVDHECEHHDCPHQQRPVPSRWHIRVVVQDHETLDLGGSEVGSRGCEGHPGEDGDPTLDPGDEGGIFAGSKLGCPVILGACNGCSERMLLAWFVLPVQYFWTVEDIFGLR